MKATMNTCCCFFVVAIPGGDFFIFGAMDFFSYLFRSLSNVRALEYNDHYRGTMRIAFAAGILQWF